jgi:hypothetical protein
MIKNNSDSLTTITMFDKGLNEDVTVYNFSEDMNTAIIWSSSQAARNNGNGWIKRARKYIIPYPYAENFKKGITSKTQLNKIKAKIKIQYAIYETTDGATWTDWNKAVEHQKEIDNYEDDKNA